LSQPRGRLTLSNISALAGSQHHYEFLLALAERLIMPRGVPVPVMGASGSSPAYMTKATMLEVAGRRFPEFSFATGDFLDRLGEAVGTRVDGVLGANAFQNLVLRIDYAKQRLSLENP
jgi:hypothetical protein